MSFNFEDIKETLRIKKDKVSLHILTSSGMDNDFFVLISPTLMVSGYGETEEEAKKSFLHNLTVFINDIMQLVQSDRDAYLKKLGFQKEPLKNKNFSRPYIDSEGSLRNLPFESQKTSFLQATV